METSKFGDQLALIDAITTNEMSSSPIFSSGNRKRPCSPENEFEKYHANTLGKIEELKRKIKVCTDKKEIKRCKNMISAYRSRLHKREDIEQLKEDLNQRNN